MSDTRQTISLDSPDWKATSTRISSTFTPAAPVANRDLFAGRIAQLEDLMDAISQLGQHAVIYGERGVGKTSLAALMETFHKSSRIAVKINCDSTDDFSSLWEKILEEVELLEQHPHLDYGQSAASVGRSFRNDNEVGITPNDARRLAKALAQITQRSSVFFFDEFDRLENRHVRALMADTIKTLSDQTVPATIVIIGVADTIHELIAEHESVQRAIVQIKMPRMEIDELLDILKRGFETIGMKINVDTRRIIATLSQGFPHYTHLLGQASARIALNNGWLEVTEDEVIDAMMVAIRKAQQTITDDYVKATSSARKDATYGDVLLACALAPVNDLGYFSASDIKPYLKRITGRDYEVSNFNRQLTKLSSAPRGPALLKKGASRSTRYRFANPMLEPHVIIKGIISGKLKVSEVEAA